MPKFDWKEIVGAVAPILATTLTAGNPLAGIAVKVLSEKFLNKPDGTEDELATIMTGASPEILAEVKKVEADFKVRMKEAGVDLEKTYATDRANARAKEIATGDKTPKILAGVYTVGYFALLGSIMKWGLPEGEGTREVLIALISIMTGAQMMIMTYYFGSSKGSSDKTKMLTGIR